MVTKGITHTGDNVIQLLTRAAQATREVSHKNEVQGHFLVERISYCYETPYVQPGF